MTFRVGLEIPDTHFKLLLKYHIPEIDTYFMNTFRPN